MNMLDAVRFNRNWTNYYMLCRNNLTNSNDEISYGSGTDLVHLISSSSDEQHQYMLADPLLPNQFNFFGSPDPLFQIKFKDFIEFLQEHPWYRYEPWKAERP